MELPEMMRVKQTFDNTTLDTISEKIHSPADVYYGRGRDILSLRKIIKKNTKLQLRRYNCSLKVA